MYKYSPLILAVLFSSILLGQKKSTFKETTKNYITYPFSDPNPIPENAKIYPYFRFDGFSLKGKEQNWKVVELENDYIKVQIMPEIGGKIWTAFDKKTGKDFLYNNGVVKFRDIAMRGPWVSGGIEMNYGIIGHTPNSATPVDYLVKNNDDGSVSCFTSTLDLLTRTRWVVETKLEKDKAYFTTTSYWFNATGIEQPYYTWMNAGIPVGEELQFLYPGNFSVGHGGDIKNWPIDDKGRNLSFYEENNFGPSKSYHIIGSHSNYFGALWKKEDYGMIHFANRDDKLGKKIFLWAQSDAGKVWEELLTDKSGQYVEIQSGRLFNQNVIQSSFTPFKQIGFMPYNGDQWTEYWYPFNGLDGFSHANKTGAFNIKSDLTGVLSVKISPTQPINDSIKVFNADREKIGSVLINANPLQMVDVNVKLPKGEKPVSMVLNGELIDFVENESDKNLSRPMHIPESFDSESTYGLYLQGRDLYRFRKYKLAEEKIKASLSKDNLFLPSLVEMMKLKIFRMDYDSAFYYGKKALSIDTYNGEANYYYGLAAAKLSKNNDALDGFEVAALTPNYRIAAYTALAHNYLAKQNYIKAEEYAMLSVKNNPNNIDAWQVLQVLARLKGNDLQIKTARNQIEKLNPINHFIRFEDFYKSPTENNKEKFQALIQNELPIESYLELAIWYANSNRFDESIKVLELSPKNTEVLFWLAWLNKQTNNSKSKLYLDRAEKSDLSFVFPFREETAEILEWVTAQKESWKANYLLALIHGFRGNKEKALDMLTKHSKPNDFAPYYFLKAKLDVKSSVESKLRLIEKASQIEPKQWRYNKALSNLYIQLRQYKNALKTLQKQYKSDNTNYIIGLDLAKTYMLNNQYKKAEKILSDITVLPFEGATDSYRYYRQTKLMLAHNLMEKKKFKQALTKINEAEIRPRNLGIGKPFEELINNDIENRLRAAVYKKMGDESSYQKHLDSIKNKTDNNKTLLEMINAISFKSDQRMF
ncbi:DUF5107 domain-containing protein [Aureibaculum conchae]|uniref:DUF5107 domain-containing protein n=1 Tax=Aureibaculum sp. 2308TA14-22 TaxID=3108392 RepID=UPI003399262E